MKKRSANSYIGYIRFIFSVALLMFSCFSFGQPGKSGAVTISALNTVVNCYSSVTNNVSAGATSVTVNNSGGSNCNWECGDLVMIYQVQGASVNTSNSDSYGAITAYNSSGLYEFNYVTFANGNTVNLQNPLVNSYATSGRIQLIKVPSYTSLTVNAGASIVPVLWQDGGSFRKGGVVAIHCTGTVTVNGTIHATSY
ncbi:hypothetical protein, partial [Fluviicola sp.]|uniref:hypothetical protein n=1 Tax=Fluviicola sp. TaxID=1917219 RepID=UPI00283A5F0D